MNQPTIARVKTTCQRKSEPVRASARVHIGLILLYLAVTLVFGAVGFGSQQAAVAAATAGNSGLGLEDWLDRINFQSTILPAEDMAYSGRALVSVYGFLRNRNHDLVLIYGYTTVNGDSVYRAYSLGRSQVLAQFDHPRGGGGEVAPSPFTQIRDYIAKESVETWPIKSLLMPLSLSSNLQVLAHNQGQCVGPFSYWIEWLRQSPGRTKYNQPVVQSSARMVLRTGDQPRPFVIQAACPLADAHGLDSLTGSSTVQSILLAQGIATGKGGLLAFGSTEPVVLRFDGAGTSRIIESRMQAARTQGLGGQVTIRSFGPEIYEQAVAAVAPGPGATGDASAAPPAPDGAEVSRAWHGAMLRRLGLK